MSEKRQDYISWDEYFMGVAKLAGLRSKDPNSQVGSCIVSPDNKILSIGYNGFPRGCSDDVFPWSREGDELPRRQPGRKQNLCVIVPVQRMLQGDYPKRN